METCKTSSKLNEGSVMLPFISGLFQDICDLYPEYDFSFEKDQLSLMSHEREHDVAFELSTIGKAFETAIITNQKFDISSLPTFGTGHTRRILKHRTSLPAFFYDLWSEVLFDDGTPRWNFESGSLSTFDCLLGRLSEVKRQRTALAVICLRQFFLGLSKLETLECLRHRSVRDQFLRLTCAEPPCDNGRVWRSVECTQFAETVLLRRFRLRLKLECVLGTIQT